jgi:hypothetical protein
MKNVTPVLDHFRVTARSVWNSAFWPDPDFRNWNAAERFQEIQRILFDELVLTKLGRQWPLEDIFSKPIPFLHVVPASPRVTVMIEKPRPNDRNRYWDDPVRSLTQGEAELHFQQYFDWNQMDYQDFLYYRAAIVAFDAQPHLVGREALIERQYGAVWLADG